MSETVVSCICPETEEEKAQETGLRQVCVPKKSEEAADLSVGRRAESPGGGQKNSAKLSRRRENPRFKQAFRTVLKSGLRTHTHTSEGWNTNLCGSRQGGHLPVQHVSGLVQQFDGRSVICSQTAGLNITVVRDSPPVCV